MGQGQVVGRALFQHFGEAALGTYVQQQDLLVGHLKTDPQVVDSGAFLDVALFG